MRGFEAYNCADFATDTVDGVSYCGDHARNARSRDTGSDHDG